jgi:histidine triad (HIT) family protein
MEGCIFCKIVEGRIPISKVYEDDNVLAFDDIQPMSPVHVIVIPKQHLSTLLDVDTAAMHIMNMLIKAVQEVAKIKGIDRKGFRVVINCNEEGGQVILHLHIHVLGGKKLKDELA